MDPERKATLKSKAVHEFKEYWVIFFYLFIYLAMFVQYKSLVLAQQHIDFAAHGIAVINALVLSKLLLIARAFHPGSQADNAPLIYPTLLKSAILAIATMVLKIFEDIIVGHFHGRSVAQSLADLAGGGGKAILILTVILFVILIPLTAFGELERVIGEEKLHALFLRPRDDQRPAWEPPST